jgi:hypothetical protein
MRMRRVVFSIVLILAIVAAIIIYRQFVMQVPCGNDLFADGNGSFESGNFVVNGGCGMDLPDGATDLTAWTIAVDQKSHNPMGWCSNENRFSVKAHDGDKFITLAGDGNPPQEPYPLIKRTGISVHQGHYRLGFFLGQDRNEGFPGPVSADIRISGAATLQSTRVTDANGPNWQPFTVDFDVPADGTVDIAFNATAGQSKQPARYVGLDSVSLFRLETLSNCINR